jgi:hypothetical protein
MLKLTNKSTLIVLASLVIVISVFLVLLTQSISTPEEYEMELEKIQTQSHSDDVNAIEKDLMDTDLDDLDAGIAEIEKELNY